MAGPPAVGQDHAGPARSPAAAPPTQGTVTLDGVRDRRCRRASTCAARCGSWWRTRSSSVARVRENLLLGRAREHQRRRAVGGARRGRRPPGGRGAPPGPRHRARRPRPHRVGRPAPAARPRLRAGRAAARARARRCPVGRRPSARDGDPRSPHPPRAPHGGRGHHPAGQRGDGGRPGGRAARAVRPGRPSGRGRRAASPPTVPTTCCSPASSPSCPPTATQPDARNPEATADDPPTVRRLLRPFRRTVWRPAAPAPRVHAGRARAHVDDAGGARRHRDQEHRPGPGGRRRSRSWPRAGVAVLTYFFKIEAKKVEEGVGYVLRRRAFAPPDAPRRRLLRPRAARPRGRPGGARPRPDRASSSRPACTTWPARSRCSS